MPKRKLIILLGVLFALTLLIPGGLFYYYFWRPWYLAQGFDYPFVVQQWQKEKGNEEQDNPRGKMVRSLLREHHLIGKSKEEIIALLGPPDSTVPCEAPPAKANEFEYILGWYSGFRMDPDFLTIKFDKKGKAIKYYVWQS
jgi:hypothetical protein